MSDTEKIVAEKRTEFGKGAARRVRRANKIPAVLYGHGTEPVHLTLPGHATMMAVKVANAVLTLDIDGKEQLALAKDVQRDPIKPIIEHVDLVVVKRGEKVTVDVPVTTVGEAGQETVVTVENATVSVQAEATNIPEVIEVDIEGKEAGTQILASDLSLPQGVALDADPELLIVNITEMISQEALDAELEAAAEELGIEEEPSDEEKAEEAAGEAAEGENAEGGEAAEGDSEEKSE